ncbi:hypothetical protein FWG76_00315 [Candidatus Saccharibacteria bacterium]|nr:hypothetical protein [Candidatus Saccharibacteria bacterium]
MFGLAKQRERLVNLESAVGAKIFGALPEGRRREFFCHTPTEWFWHEEWTDEYGLAKRQTVRYIVSGGQVIKKQVGQPNTVLAGPELKNFTRATRKYLREVKREIYGQ